MTDTLPRPLAAAAPVAPTSTLTWAENRLMRDGAPTRLLSGSVHYFRIHPDQWRDRLQRVKDLGLNTVDTYVPWNFHQPRPDEAPDFTGWRDLERFLLIAADLGLDATVRPGPYICAEWSNGGLPVWLTARGIPLRSSDERFLGPVREWFSCVLPRIAALQANVGGPVVAVQVENEFGSFGDDRSYPAAIARGLRDHGITELLFTADGPTELMLDAGAVDGVLQGLTLGSRVGAARDLARTRRPDEPLLVAEYWNGWFDHWGHPHHVRGSANAAETLAAIVEDGGSVALYMAHGGTNFGLWAGANRVDGELRGTVTSYDSDAPIAEDGTLTEKFHAMREVLGATEPIVSLPPRMVAPQQAEIIPGAGLGQALAILARAPRPVASTVAFEELGQDSGMLLLSAEVMLPTGEIELVFPRVADRAMVRVEGRPVGTVVESGTVTVTGTGAPARIDVVIDNLGRVNYGWSLGERKGLLDPVLVQRRVVQKWQAASIDVAAAGEAAIARLGLPGEADAAGGATAVFHLPESADAHLALPGFARGFVWINGFLLGRYWEIGPQQTLYVPAPLLRAGANIVTVLELERRGIRLELRDRPELGPEEEYIEHF